MFTFSMWPLIYLLESHAAPLVTLSLRPLFCNNNREHLCICKLSASPVSSTFPLIKSKVVAAQNVIKNKTLHNLHFIIKFNQKAETYAVERIGCWIAMVPAAERLPLASSSPRRCCRTCYSCPGCGWRTCWSWRREGWSRSEVEDRWPNRNQGRKDQLWTNNFRECQSVILVLLSMCTSMC